MEPSEFLQIGEVVGVHGLKGNLKIRSYADSLSVFNPGRRLVVKTPAGSQRTYTIQSVRPHSRTTLLTFSDVVDRDSAEKLVGSALLIQKTELVEPENGAYYWFDLIGISVFTVAGEYLGQIDSILETGSNDVYVIKDPDRGRRYERLVPALKSVVTAIDLENRTMRVDLPEGL